MWFGILIGFLISLLITMILLNKNNEILEIYPSQRIASKLNNISYKALNNCLKGKSKTSGGYKWKYANEREVK